jgi:DNA-binding response OmpR family regulator
MVPAPSARSSPAGAPRPTVVVADPDPVFRGLLEQLLREEGYEPLVPPAPAAPYPFVKAARPAAVVLGVPFRGEAETLATLAALRRDPATAALPVVVCTATPGALEGLARREGEGLSVLAKPVDLDRLLAKIRAQLGKGAGA